MNIKARWPTVVAFFVMLISFGLYFYSIKQHYDLIYGMSNSKSFCSISSLMDCDAVNTSSFSEVFGIPVALLGAFTFVIEFLLLLAYRGFGEEEKQKMARLFLYFCTFNMAVVFYEGFAMFFILKLICTICLSLYLCSLILFVCALKLVNKPRYSMGQMRSDFSAKGVWIILAIVPLGSLLAHGMYKESNFGELDKIVTNSIADWQANEKIDFFTDKAPDLGNPKGKFQIVEFSDFQCPHCRRASPTLHAFVNSHRDDAHFIFQSYPLDPSCNKYMKNGGHDLACLMAKASLCAHKQGKFWQAQDWIFENQESLNLLSTDTMVTAVGLDKSSFQACLADGGVGIELAEQIERGHLAGIQGTPAVYVNGKHLPFGHLTPVLNAAYKLTQ